MSVMASLFSTTQPLRGRLAALAAALALAACSSSPVDFTGPKAANANTEPAGTVEEDLQPMLKDAAIYASQNNDYVAAAAHWGALYEANPSNLEAALKFAQALRYVGAADKSVLVLEQAAAQRPQDATVLAELGKSLAAAGRSDEAVSRLGEALALNPRDWRILSAMGVAHDRVGRHKEAQAQYLQAIKLAPNNPQILNNLGLSQALAGDLADAERTMRKAVSAPGATSQIRQNLALVLGLNGRFAEAERLASADLPPALVENNISYYRDVLAEQPRWNELTQ